MSGMTKMNRRKRTVDFRVDQHTNRLDWRHECCYARLWAEDLRLIECIVDNREQRTECIESAALVKFKSCKFPGHEPVNESASRRQREVGRDSTSSPRPLVQ